MVALGTDGFGSDMVAEREAGARLAVARGQPGSIAAVRLQSGSRMASHWFAQSGPDALTVEGAEIVSIDNAGAGIAARGGAGSRPPSDPTRNRPVVDRLVVSGRTVVDGGRLMTGNWETIRENARVQAGRLAAAMQSL